MHQDFVKMVIIFSSTETGLQPLFSFQQISFFLVNIPRAVDPSHPNRNSSDLSVFGRISAHKEEEETAWCLKAAGVVKASVTLPRARIVAIVNFMVESGGVMF